ncbi:hypothetical protein G1H11_01810 [Phytoactinopolyspora alkaliphila]|uniref:Uncharacterized protein n=1 Tax=Phytoactinopolyspora alkaliphila TaxID=1783498 RepID=A0A6N9YG56_9ACTN|nr:hypothetical protein [Phytoactinopolyspora alkaliphila]NED94041.1 hypothetical protein [Phytoactinopolyspora alkaliphila]
MRASAALDEAIGAVRTWRQCDAAVALELLLEQQNPGGVDAEATRVARVVDHEADGRSDPDWD